MTTITVSRQSLRRPMDNCPCLAAQPPEASRAALQQQAAVAQQPQASSSGVDIGLIVGVSVGVLAFVLLVAAAAVVAAHQMQRRRAAGGKKTAPECNAVRTTTLLLV